MRRLQGRKYVPSNGCGRKMAQNVAHFDVCYCSPLICAKEIVEIILKNRGIKIIEDQRLVEMSFGIYEGFANHGGVPDSPINVLFVLKKSILLQLRMRKVLMSYFLEMIVSPEK